MFRNIFFIYAIKKTIWIILFCVLGHSSIQGQKAIRLKENTIIKKYSHELAKMKSTSGVQELIDLPFFDDFSTGSYSFGNELIFPDTAKWTDRYVYINNKYAIQPITLGVATLDAIDENGDLYHTNPKPTSADMLTSKTFSLQKYSGTDSIYLSFFYQAGGKGDDPGPVEKDSLIVEFFYPPTHQWVVEWSAYNVQSDTFLRAIVPVPDSFYLDTFQFRFRNFTSYQIDEYEGGNGAVSNADLWHIDYVRLDTGSYQEHTTVYDIAFMEPLLSTLKDFESVPWSHYNLGKLSGTRLTIPISIRTNNKPPGASGNILRGYYVKDLIENSYVKDPYIEGSQVLLFDTIIERNDVFTPSINNNGSDTGIFEIGAYLSGTPLQDSKSNDTVKRIETYENYYAYDDGSAEFGFGFTKALTLLGIKYEPYQADTLRALNIYFNKTKDNYTAIVPFKICVWADNNGSPGELLYISQSSFYPNLDLGYNEFEQYLLETPLYIDGIVYVGMKMITDDFINIGYDANTNAKNKIFYYIASQWESPDNSIPDGSVMIRPVFSQSQLLEDIVNRKLYKYSLNVFPNPTTKFIQWDYSKLEKIVAYRICNSTGQIIQSAGFLYDDNRIDVENIPSGFYFLSLYTNSGSQYIAKFIKK